MKLIKQLTQYLTEDVWKIQLKDLPKNKKFLIKQLRIFLLAIRGFNEDRCLLQASALTFYSILSIVPVIAMAFGIAKGFGFEKMIEKELGKMFAGHDDILLQATTYAHNMLENAKGGIIAGIGVVILLWTVIQVLGNIENSFNDIWQVKTGRGYFRKVTDYLSIMIISPIIIILSSSVTAFITTNVEKIVEEIELLGYVSSVMFFFLRLLPYCLIWILFTMLYAVMPNTKVNFKAAFLSGIIAGSVFQLVQHLYINLQVGVSSYNAIYGSFAALPLFFIWTRISWLIVLFGAEISFAQQNVNTYEFEVNTKNVSPSYRKILLFMILHTIIKRFEIGEPPHSVSDLSEKLTIPSRMIRSILYDLTDANILTALNEEDTKDQKYQPAIDIHKISIEYVLSALDSSGTREIPVIKNKSYEQLLQIDSAFSRILRASKENVLVKDL